MRIIDRSWTRSFLLALAALGAAAAAHAQVEDTRPVSSRPTSRPSECRACGAPGAADGLEFAVSGRYVPLCGGPCIESALADPDAVLSGRQARAGLFDEKALSARGASWAWFAFGTYVFAGLLAGAWCAHAAFRKGKSPAAWLAIGLATNVLGVAALALASGESRTVPGGVGKIHDTFDPVPCSACGAPSHPSAVRCARCGAAISPIVASEATRARG